jgi:hypothetical protein
MAAGNADPNQGEDAVAEPQAGTVQPAPIHSKAFENLVNDPEDIVGLLAYAKFKQSVHEAACNGNIMDRPSRNLTPAMVDVLRSAAEQLIGQVVEDGIQAAAPEIEKSALKTAMEAQFTDMGATIKSERANVTDHIDRRTSFLNAFLTNIAAWAVTLLVAVVIVYLFNRPSPEETIIKVAKPVAPANPATQAGQRQRPAIENRSAQ